MMKMNNLEKKIVMKNGKFEYATVETVIFKHSDKAIAAFAKKCVKNLAWTKNDFEYALKLGTAAGSATAFSEGLAEKSLIMDVLAKL